MSVSNLKEQVCFELNELQKLLLDNREHLNRLEGCDPGRFEIAAAAAILHSFYTGIENIFKRIEKEFGALPATAGWHRELLGLMCNPSDRHPQVISNELGELLAAYMGFRHVFRQAYSHQLDWNKMLPLLLRREEVFGTFKLEIESFLEKICTR